jgi:serine/threonine protein phosphatase PrpC
MEQINKDKNLKDMNCGILNGNVMSPNKSNIKKDNKYINNSHKKHIQIKRNKKKFSEENNEIPLKNAGKETFSAKNSLIYDLKLMENNNNSNIKNKILDINKKNNIINNVKSSNKPKELIRKNKNNKINLNHSLEYRNKFNINKQDYDNKFSMTMSNGFFGGNSSINHIRNINSNLNINKFKKQKRKKSLNSNLNMYINKINQKDSKKGVLASSYVKKDNKLKMIKDSMNKKFNKSIANNRGNINVNNINNINNMINKKQNNVQTNKYKYKPSPTHSKHESNLPTERANINKRNKKVIVNNFNSRSRNYAQNRSLSKDHFQTEPTQKLNLNFNKSYINNKVIMPGINDESLSINLSNKTNVIKAQYIRNKKNENEIDKNMENNKVPNGQVNTSYNNVVHSSSKKKEYPNMSSKKEYPNMAKYLYGKRPSSGNVDEEEVKSSKNKETKAIKKIESLCKKGYSGPGVKKTNQDNFFIYNNFNNNSNYVYLGVCDGHGLFGQDISGYLVNNLPQNMNNIVISKGIKNLSTEKITTLSEIFQETFVQTNSALNVDERIDSSFSGSTCVSLLFTPTRIFCINVGDSRCIIGKFNGYEWNSKVLSRDHKPSEPDEMNRILKSGGRVEAYRDNFGNFVGPERVWSKQGDGPGLAMSRSFGDEIGHKVGVVVDPEIMEHNFIKEDKFIVLGSDGIWEFIGNDEVVEIVKDYYLENNIEGAIEHLYNEASKRWIMEEQVIDDITVMIIFLN